MSFHDLPAFIDALRESGELLEFREPGSVENEIACLADRYAHALARHQNSDK